MRKSVLYALVTIVLLFAIAGFYWQRHATRDRQPATAPRAQEPDCVTPPPPEEKPPAPAGLAMAEPCGDGAAPAGKSAPPATVK